MKHSILNTEKLHKYPDTAARLVRAGYGVYGIDHEGHGRSSGSRCYVPNFGNIVADCSSHFTSICGTKRTSKT
jgi:alpha-beta hydrolase superfamily lysophospholipase